MFSRVCDVYAPMYRQDTSPGIYSASDRSRVPERPLRLEGLPRQLQRRSRRRSCSATRRVRPPGRLIDEEIDPNPGYASRLVWSDPSRSQHPRAQGRTGRRMYAQRPGLLRSRGVRLPGGLLDVHGIAGRRPSLRRSSVPATGPTRCRVPIAAVRSRMRQSGRSSSGEDLLTPLVNMDYLLAPPPEAWNSFLDAPSPTRVAPHASAKGPSTG